MDARIATTNDIHQVMALQKQNLFANLSEAEREDGFVTTPFTYTQIREIIGQKGLFVTEIDGKIIAYAFAGSWKYFSQWKMFKVMIASLPKLIFDGKRINTQNTFQYGPICIDNNYRGNGVLQALFEKMRLEMIKKYPISITFINKENKRSLFAHTQKLNWDIIDEFEFNNKTYLTLGFNMKNSVL
ncbi:MAG: GNAT family acetyltransferase [Saprospiraceae bacterium]